LKMAVYLCRLSSPAPESPPYPPCPPKFRFSHRSLNCLECYIRVVRTLDVPLFSLVLVPLFSNFANSGPLIFFPVFFLYLPMKASTPRPRIFLIMIALTGCVPSVFPPGFPEHLSSPVLLPLSSSLMRSLPLCFSLSYSLVTRFTHLADPSVCFSSPPSV